MNLHPIQDRGPWWPLIFPSENPGLSGNREEWGEISVTGGDKRIFTGTSPFYVHREILGDLLYVTMWPRVLSVITFVPRNLLEYSPESQALFLGFGKQ